MLRRLVFSVFALGSLVFGLAGVSAQELGCSLPDSSASPESIEGITPYYNHNFPREVGLATVQLFNPNIASRANVAYYFPSSGFGALLTDTNLSERMVDRIVDGEVNIVVEAENQNYYGVMTNALAANLIGDQRPDDLSQWMKENNVVGFVHTNDRLENSVTDMQIMTWDCTPYSLIEFSERYGNDFPNLTAAMLISQ